MYIVFNKHIDEDTLEEFVNKVNSSGSEKIRIYLSSMGGNCDVMPVLRDIIEKNNIELVAYGQVGSAALDLFLTTNTQRYILDEAYALVHSTKIDNVMIDINMKPVLNKYLLPILSEEIKEYDMILDFFKVSDGEKQDIKNNVNVYYNTNRFRQALKESEKFFKNSLVDKLI